MKLKTLLFSLLLLMLWACAGGDNPLDPGSSVVDIAIRNNLFVPAQKTVSVGTTVRWTNDDPVEMENDFHTVDSGRPMSPTTLFNKTFTAKDQSEQYTFNSPGVFPYYCARHGETGTITVN